jgi:hypothetical protein
MSSLTVTWKSEQDIEQRVREVKYKNRNDLVDARLVRSEPGPRQNSIRPDTLLEIIRRQYRGVAIEWHLAKLMLGGTFLA